MSSFRGEVSDLLIQRGFVRKDRIHLRPLQDDVSAYVDIGPIDRRTDLAPWVGLRIDAIEHLRAELLGQEADPESATIAVNAGTLLLGKYRTWQWPTSEGDVVAEIEAALKVLEGYASVARIPAAWQFPGMPSPDPYTMVAIHLLLKNREEVRSWLERGESLRCRQLGPVCDQFRRFERNVAIRLARS